MTLSMAIPDAIAGHVIGRVGTGLHLIHGFSHPKVSISVMLNIGRGLGANSMVGSPGEVSG